MTDSQLVFNGNPIECAVDSGDGSIKRSHYRIADVV